jgi:hypothetical protein
MIDTERIRNRYDLREVAARYTALRKESVRELSGPCPRSGCSARRDGFHVQAGWFFCRRCHPKRGDVIEFVRWLHSLTFLEAVALLEGGDLPRCERPRQPESAEQSEAWRRRAQVRMDAWRRTLLDDPVGELGRSYLAGRGLLPETWRVFGLGFNPGAALPGTNGQRRAPAIAIPWYRRGEGVGIRFRFLERQCYVDAEGNERDEKITSLFRSDLTGVFGGQTLGKTIPAYSTLLICEGELNAMSVWQVSQGTHLDVLSTGTEGAHIPPAVLAYARRYRTVLAWFDRAENARSQAVTVGAYALRSPHGLDANDLLRRGELQEYMAEIRRRACRNDEERKAVEFDLLDGQEGSTV